jgi:hypothetical protein
LRSDEEPSERRLRQTRAAQKDCSQGARQAVFGDESRFRALEQRIGANWNDSFRVAPPVVR